MMRSTLLDKPRIRQSFAAASATYDQAAHLQRESAIELMLASEKEEVRGTVLDLGCGTGYLTGLLSSAERRPDSVVALDIASAMLTAARGRMQQRESSHPRIHYVCADAERLPFAANSFDAVYSNLALQWCEPLEKVFADLKRISKPGSHLIASTFGPKTLQELKQAWAEVDNLPHVNSFRHEEELLDLLQAAGFGAGRITQSVHVSRYASVVELMRELKHIGAHNVHLERSKGLTGKARMQAMFSAYECYRSEGLLPATFEILLVTARA